MFQCDVGSKPVCVEAKIVKHNAQSAGRKRTNADDETCNPVKSFSIMIARLALRVVVCTTDRVCVLLW